MRIPIIITLTVFFFVFGQPQYLSDPACPVVWKALSYHVFHANIFHLAANSLSIWYMFRYSWSRKRLSELIYAFVIATLTYICSARPVIGFSNILFATLGLRTPSLSHGWWRLQSTKIFFAVTLLMLCFPQFSAITHILSFIAGSLIAMLKRKFNSLEDDIRHATNK